MSREDRNFWNITHEYEPSGFLTRKRIFLNVVGKEWKGESFSFTTDLKQLEKLIQLYGMDKLEIGQSSNTIVVTILC